MLKIASPQQLQNEILRILAYAQGDKPSREVLAHNLRELADRVAGTRTAGMPAMVKRVVRMVRNEGVEEKPHKVMVKFKSEADANKFEDRAKGNLGIVLEKLAWINIIKGHEDTARVIAVWTTSVFVSLQCKLQSLRLFLNRFSSA